MIWVVEAQGDGLPGWLIFLLVMACFWAYVFIGGLFHEGIKNRYDGGRGEPWGLLWPFVLPVHAGMSLAEWVKRPRIPKAKVVRE